MTTLTRDYSVDLEVFQGPLDLLLYLIRKDEVDIYDIPIASITAQYLKYVEVLKLLNLENAGDYILMAATLIRIKARMLLPRGADDDDSLDPREELTQALLEYRKFKEASDILREKREFESRLTNIAGRSNGFRSEPPVIMESSSLYDLVSAFMVIIRNFREDEAYLVNRPDISVDDRIDIIVQALADRQFITFHELFADICSKLMAIVTFIAVLEMVKSRRITVRQSKAFSELRIYKTDRLHEQAAVEELTNYSEAIEGLIPETVEY
jgi:segregation and condensation protein A